MARWCSGSTAAAFEPTCDIVRRERDERELDFIELRTLARRHLDTMQREAGEAFPQDPQAQLRKAIAAVFASWRSDKARAYRAEGPGDDIGTAVTVQRMVFGNAGGLSGAGVGFTRHPTSGEPEPWVDFLFNAQGEDVVSGRRSAQGHEELAAVAPLCGRNCWRPQRNWSRPSATCRTSSSPSRTAGCTCCRRATASARRRRRRASRSTFLNRA